MATENVRVLTVDTGAAQTSVKDLRSELKRLKDTLLSTEEGTQEYNDTLERAADIQHTLKEQMEEVNASAMDFGQITGNIVKATGGLVAGLQAAKATMSLFGVENEEILKSLEKMQNLMAITQAIPALDDGVKAFKRLGLVIKSATAGMSSLKVALASTGIGLAVVAVGALAANWDKVSDAMKRWGIINEDTQKKIEEQRKKIEKANADLKKAKQAYEDWEKADKIGRLNKERKEEYEILSRLVEKYELLAAAKGKDADAETDREKWKVLFEQYLELENTAKKYKALQREILNDPLSFIETVSVKEVLNEDAFLDWKKKIEQRILADKEKNTIKVPVNVEIEDGDENTITDELKNRTISIIESLRGAFITPENQYQQEIDALDLALKTKLIKEEEYLKLRDALNKEQTQNEVARYAVAANAIGGIFNSIGEMMEEGSEEQKAFQIMGATVNMLAGIATAIAGAYTTHTGPWDIALAAIQAAAIAASGSATIAKMVKTNKNNAASMSSAKPSTAALASINAPVQYTQDVQGASIEGAIKDSRVYVTETDITDTQRKVSVAESEAMF